jgi:tRNA(Ile)-lysidine synthase TilS/MesJ
LPPVDGPWIRPLIRARKAAVRAHLGRHGIIFAEDPSNADRRYLRTRVRHEVLPLLVELSPGIVEHLNAIADELVAAPLPEISDEAGRPVSLRRAHAREIRRAYDLGSAARVRVSSDKELVVDPRTRTVRMEAVEPDSARAENFRARLGPPIRRK